MKFGTAIEKLRAGLKVSRKGWNGKGMYLMLQVPDKNSKMKQPYIFIVPDENSLVPWVASQVDILGEDWVVVK